MVPRPAVAHHPHGRRGALPAARHSHCALWRPGAPPGRTAVGHADGLQTHLGALCQDRTLPLDFDSFFQEVLAQFDTQGDEFAPQRVQDELIGQMSELLGIGYDVLALDLTESESRHRALVSDPTPPAAPPALPSPTAGAAPGRSIVHRRLQRRPVLHPPALRRRAPCARIRPETTTESPRPPGDLLLEHIVSPAPTTERLQSIQRMVADQLGDALPPDFSASVLQSIPVQAGGLYPISDVWYIDAGLDTPDRLRITSRSSRARSPGRQPGRVHRGSLRWHRLRLLRARPCTIAARPGGAGAAHHSDGSAHC